MTHFDAWTEYDYLAEWCAKHGKDGSFGTVLPDGVSAQAMDLINEDVDAFMERVRSFRYAQCMNRRNEP